MQGNYMETEDMTEWLLGREQESPVLAISWFSRLELDCRNARDGALRSAYGGAREELIPVNILENVEKLLDQTRFNALLSARVLDKYRSEWQRRNWQQIVIKAEELLQTMLGHVEEIEGSLRFVKQLHSEYRTYPFRQG